MTIGRASCSAATRRSSPSRYSWPRWRPSNTPTTASTRPSDRASALVPSTTVIDCRRSPSAAVTSAMQDLRRRDPEPVAPAHPDDRTGLVDEAQRDAVGGATKPGGWPDEAALAGVCDL